MYVKNNTRTLCKFILYINLKHFRLIYDKNNGLYYNICNCYNMSCCKKSFKNNNYI